METDARPSRTVKVAACQLPAIFEDVETCLKHIELCGLEAEAAGISILLFPEAYLQGYLTTKESARRHAIDLSSAEFDRILQRLALLRPTVVLGLIEIENGTLFNSAVVISGGQLVGKYRKTHLHGSEAEVFEPGAVYPVFTIDGLKVGINICFDAQFPEAAAAVARQGARLILLPANNLMSRQKALEWKDLHNATRAERTRETGLWLMSADVTGEADGKLGIGPTAVLDPQGRVVAQVPAGEAGMVVANFDVPLRDASLRDA